MDILFITSMILALALLVEIGIYAKHTTVYKNMVGLPTSKPFAVMFAMLSLVSISQLLLVPLESELLAGHEVHSSLDASVAHFATMLSGIGALGALVAVGYLMGRLLKEDR